MKLFVLMDSSCDNNTAVRDAYYGEAGISLYIEDEGKKILFDLGYSGIILENAKIAGIDISDLDYIVVSHGHDDHAGGLKRYLEEYSPENLKFICHPEAFKSKYSEGEYIGMPISREELEKKAKVITSKKPIYLTKNIVFLGEIPTKFGFEERKYCEQTINEAGEVVGDYVFDDSALVYKGKEGIYVLSGCAHSGICNIVEYAKEVTKCDNVIGVIGGFHIFDPSEDRVKKTIEYFENAKIEKLYPCHCTGFPVRAELYNKCNGEGIDVGMEFDWK